MNITNNSFHLKRIKDLATIKGGQDQKSVLSDDGKFPIYGTGGIFGYANKYLYNKPSVLLGRKGTIDKPLLVLQPFWSVDTMYYTEIKKDVDYRYFYYRCLTLPFGLFNYGSTVPSTSQRDISAFITPVPTLYEQTQIANYLDTKTQAINKKINLLTTKIEYYKELRKTIINNAVTKGLDKNVKLKESELGLKPSHWAISRLKEVSKTMSSGATPLTNIDAYYEDGIVNWVNTGDLNDSIVENCQYKISQLAINDYPNLKVNKPGTLMIAMYGATIGKIGLLNIYATSNQACCRINFNKHNFSKFYFYWFLAYKQFMISLSVGGTQPNVGQGIIGKMLVAVPPIKEQSEIATYLDTKTNTIDKITTNLQTQIETLKELRKTLINDVVTGKVKVTPNQ